MIKSFVVDASVVLKWFRSLETGSAEAISLRRRHVDEEVQLCAPYLLIYEVVNALRFKPDLGEQNVLEADTYLRDIDLEFFPPSREMLTRATHISFGYPDAKGKNPSIYDACYVALAEMLNCPLVTADRALVEQLQGHPLVVPLQDVR